ncbi:MAG TPA: SpoIIE family protein phosphatase [Leptospiraceae bacterium]|nr:SpoIIE family protein phosphatase [Leptospiraceae bacterium]HMX32460.1 SpoIIE family protein phosphatase [Leptospiraceae bacterium]HMY31023.1 SpoIIE family protein phosphatase [Leptospiraceae bacterium]HMZ65057.1 SpoIIE family protein phosphatase [Leptospiraceae bacterium]HNA05663.1 SpoIIE family protein phosphatase [Leptospiraceae bacterium]
MELTLRKKLIIGFTLLDLIISILLGVFMFQFSYGMFFQNFKDHKTSIAKFGSSLLSGEEDPLLQSEKQSNQSDLKEKIKILNQIIFSENNIQSICILSYSPDEDNFRYVIKNDGTMNGQVYQAEKSQIEKLRKVLREKSREPVFSEDEIFTKEAYVYSKIFNLKEEVIGILVLEIDSKPILDFKTKMAIVAIVLCIFTFCLTGLVAVFMAKYFFSPLEVLSDAVNNLASGNLIMIENFDKKDEFGKLAKSFNAMVNNLKIASEVQYNLIIEISNLNDNLEKIVEERTRTIQSQSQELEKQIMIAKKIQLSLLPEDVPRIKGATLSFRYQPMMGVGGDFIDFDYKNTNDLILFICDVSGHGVPAAFLATMVKMSLQECYDMKLSPAESIQRIQRSLQGKLSGHFLSAVYCHIDLQKGLMSSANAGHLPILKVGLNEEHQFINSKGRIICEAFKPSSEQIITKLEVGDKIILYTDGVTEARNNKNELFGYERLVDISLKHHFETSFNMCNHIYNSVLSFMGNSDAHFTDDITLLVAEYSGKEISI